ncbi:MAG TPA: hypothetical protein VFD04_10250, partial [Actinomycetes bacterium]|nr:hypothetical protein [Actinomycetes bacterium]
MLHVVATGQRRGAEIFTADLVAALEESGVTQRVAVLRGAGGLAVGYRAPTVALGAEAGGLPGIGVSTAGLRALRRTI